MILIVNLVFTLTGMKKANERSDTNVIEILEFANLSSSRNSRKLKLANITRSTALGIKNRHIIHVKKSSDCY